jgi:hypothetical protein
VPIAKRTRKLRTHSSRSSHRLLWALVIFVLALAVYPVLKVHAATLSSASLAVSDPRPSNLSTNYTFTGSSVTLAPIKCIKEVYVDPSTGLAPASMSTTGGGVTFDTVNSNYMPTPGAWTFTHTVNGTFTLTDAAGETPASAAARKVVINGITNSSVTTALEVQFSTFNNIDCSTSPVDSATTLFILTNGSTLSLTVNDTLTFTVNAVGSGQGCDGTTTTAASTATTIPFGVVNSGANAIVCQDLTAATNATSGYTINARYSAKPTNALAQTIADHTGTNAAPTAFSAAGTEAYGYTTNDATLGTGTVNRFTNPSQGWAAMTTTNAELAYEAAPVNSTTYRVGHQVGVSNVTRPGTYTTTVIYTCTPIY